MIGFDPLGTQGKGGDHGRTQKMNCVGGGQGGEKIPRKPQKRERCWKRAAYVVQKIRKDARTRGKPIAARFIKGGGGGRSEKGGERKRKKRNGPEKENKKQELWGEQQAGNLGVF